MVRHLAKLRGRIFQQPSGFFGLGQIGLHARFAGQRRGELNLQCGIARRRLTRLSQGLLCIGKQFPRGMVVAQVALD